MVFDNHSRVIVKLETNQAGDFTNEEVHAFLGFAVVNIQDKYNINQADIFLSDGQWKKGKKCIYIWIFFLYKMALFSFLKSLCRQGSDFNTL